MRGSRMLGGWRLPERASGGRKDIQGLRAFAVVVVILDHLAGWPRGGYVGVDMFFVISGFLITGLLLREHERTGHIGFLGFYRRRFKRIIPAAVLVLAVTVVGAFFVFDTPRFHATGVDALWALLFAGNWRFAALGTHYFSANGPVSPLQHFWTLGVEEQFYVVWPWLMLLIFAVLVRGRRSTGTARSVVAVVLVLITAGSFVWAVWESTHVPDRAYFSTFSRTWELGVGAMLAVSSRACAAIADRLRPVLAWAGIAGMVASLWVVGDVGAFPAPAAALPVLSVALVILAGTGTERHPWLLPLTNPVSVYLGDISYSLYLWHFPVIVLGAALAGDDAAHRVLYGVLIVLAAVYSYHLVENPVRRSDWLTGHREPGWPQFSQGYKVTALSLLAVVTIGLMAVQLAPSSPPKGILVSTPPLRTATGSMVSPKLHALQKEIASSLAATSWPGDLRPSIAEVLSSHEAPADVMPCGAAGQVDESRCSWGSSDATHTAITVGSSISMTYVEALRTALPADHWRVMSYGMFGCPWMDPSIYTGPLDDRAGCIARLRDAVAAINRIKPDLVFVSGIDVSGADSTKSATSEWAKVTAPSTLVVLPGPPGDVDLHACYTKTSSPSDCVATVSSTFASADQAFAMAAGGNFVPSIPWFCYEGRCPSFVGRTVAKLDSRLITPAYARRIAPVILEDLEHLDIVPKAAL